MKMISVIMLVLLVATALTLGCINAPSAPTATPTPTPVITTIPTITPIPDNMTAPATSQVYMPQQTTNGRPTPSATITPIANGSKPGGISTGELGRQ